MARPRRPIASVINASLTALALVGLFVVQAYFVGGAVGLLPAAHAEMPALAAADVPDGPIMVDYCSEAVAARDPGNPSGRTSTSVELDDAWFAATITASPRTARCSAPYATRNRTSTPAAATASPTPSRP